MPLAPFRGNRFNIVFHNGSGVFFFFEYLKSFFDRMKDENKLLKAVYYDLQVSLYVAGCLALGLIDIFITGPLWRVLENKDINVLDMSERYQQLLKCFEEWSVDATSFLKGEGVVFRDIDIQKGEVFDKLIESNPLFDETTVQVFELIFGSFALVSKRLLKVHLEGGKYDKPQPVLREEFKSAPKSNVVPEQDFISQKPNATTLVYEGIVMFTKNNPKH